MKFPTDRPVKVVMLGAGGTGGYVAPYVFRLLHMLDRPSRFVVCDGDITEYFVLGATNSVYKFSQHIAGDHVVLEFCLSPDYYEPLYFANSLVDLLRYCQCSIRRIEAKLAERETENIRKEAA